MTLKVLDLSRVLAGPVCSMMLGDLGADVIKVERPGEGDETRGWGPPFSSDGQSAYFLAVNRNKKSLAADLSDETDRGTVLDLISGADVVLENFLSGALARLGLDPDRLLTENPALIWCTISGFGPESCKEMGQRASESRSLSAVRRRGPAVGYCRGEPKSPRRMLVQACDRACPVAYACLLRSSMNTEMRFELWGGAPFCHDRYYQPARLCRGCLFTSGDLS